MTMGIFILHMLEGGFVMLALYLAYRVFLAKDKQHGFNRRILLLIYFISFIAAPLWLLVYTDPSPMINSPEYRTLRPDVIEMLGVTRFGPAQPFWCTVLIWIYIAGASAVIVRTLIVWTRLFNVVRSGTKHKRDGYTLVVTENEKYAPFSWMHYIVVTRNDFDNACSAIAAHEKAHIARRHWIDLLIAQSVCIINWFNPAAWLMRDELMLVHEYQADMAVIDSGHDVREYQLLLIKKAVGARFPSLANSLNHSKLKKRITMMYKAKSGAGRKFKALALVPALSLAVGIAAAPAVRAAVTTLRNSELVVGKVKEIIPDKQQRDPQFKVTGISRNGSETTVTIKGENLGNSLTVSGGTLTADGKTLQAKSLSSDMTDGSATITAVFPISTEGKDQGMTLNINSQEITFDLGNATETPQAESVCLHEDTPLIVIDGSMDPKSAADSSIIKFNGEGTMIDDDVEIFLDGKKISRSEIKNINPETIASISVNKKDRPQIIITTNKH